MTNIIKSIYMHFKGKEIRNAKMSEHLEVRVISNPSMNERKYKGEDDFAKDENK